jgi:hypothetical protein
MRPLAAFAFLLTIAAPVAAQAPFPGGVNINGGWVPCNHSIAIAAGLGCTADTPTPPAATTKPKPPTPPCPPEPLNLYQRLVCAPPRNTPENPWTKQPFSYEVGGRYRLVYPNSQRLIVVAIDLEPETLRRIVTGRLFPGDGLGGEGPVVFYEDNALTWVPLEPGQLH